jgi:hypothetical protein
VSDRERGSFLADLRLDYNEPTCKGKVDLASFSS